MFLRTGVSMKIEIIPPQEDHIVCESLVRTYHDCTGSAEMTEDQAEEFLHDDELKAAIRIVLEYYHPNATRLIEEYKP